MTSDPSEKEAAVGWLHVHLPIEESNPRLSVGGAARGQSLGSAPLTTGLLVLKGDSF